jgi:hypothetical protein
MKSLTIDPKKEQAPTRDFPPDKILPEELPPPKEINVHPSKAGGENASLFFVGTATTILYAHLMAESRKKWITTDQLPGNGKDSA